MAEVEEKSWELSLYESLRTPQEAITDSTGRGRKQSQTPQVGIGSNQGLQVGVVSNHRLQVRSKTNKNDFYCTLNNFAQKKRKVCTVCTVLCITISYKYSMSEHFCMVFLEINKKDVSPKNIPSENNKSVNFRDRGESEVFTE